MNHGESHRSVDYRSLRVPAVFSPRRRGGLLIPEFDSCWIVNQIAPHQLVAVSEDDRRLSAISKDRSWRIRFWSWFPLTRRPMIISMEKRIWPLDDEFWRIRTDTCELTDAGRDALRAPSCLPIAAHSRRQFIPGCDRGGQVCFSIIIHRILVGDRSNVSRSVLRITSKIGAAVNIHLKPFPGFALNDKQRTLLIAG